MARTSATPVKPIFTKITQEQIPLVETSDFLEGLITDDDPKQIPQNALTIADNVEYFRKLLMRRNGSNIWPVTKPNSSQIMDVFTFFETSTGLNILRFTPSTIHKAGTAAWTNFPPAGIAANSGSINDYFSTAVVDNRGFFSNGIDPIREIDPVAQTYKALGNAPIYKHITGAFNRIIGVNLVGGSTIPYQVGWCGESNYGEWSPLVDISAGSQNLTTSPTTISDDCTGIFSTSQTLIITRQSSIWLGTHLPSSTTPFSFFSAIPSIGADLPRTILLTDYGLVWVRNQTSAVYAWMPGANYGIIQSVDQMEMSGKIRRKFRMVLNNASQVWADYSHETRIYSVFIVNPTFSSTATVFSFNFISKTWTTSSFDGNPTYSTDIDYANSSVTINDLSGTINALVGTIDSLGTLTQNTTRAIGFANGDLITQQPFSGLTEEVSNIVLTDNGTPFTSTIATKLIEVPITDTIINLVRFSVTPFTSGSITLQYSKDDAKTWVTVKTVTFTVTYRDQLVQLRRALKGRRFIWRITTSDCMCSINGFYAAAIKAGVSK